MFGLDYGNGVSAGLDQIEIRRRDIEGDQQDGLLGAGPVLVPPAGRYLSTVRGRSCRIFVSPSETNSYRSSNLEGVTRSVFANLTIISSDGLLLRALSLKCRSGRSRLERKILLLPDAPFQQVSGGPCVYGLAENDRIVGGLDQANDLRGTVGNDTLI
jgi:hypothetical protein